MANGHVVIVGGTSGSGRALVRLFSQRYEVSLLGRRPSPEVGPERPQIRFYPTELADPDAVRASVDRSRLATASGSANSVG